MICKYFLQLLYSVRRQFDIAEIVKCRHKFKRGFARMLVPAWSLGAATRRLFSIWPQCRSSEAIRKESISVRQQWTRHSIHISKVLAEKRVRIIVSLINREWWIRVRARGNIHVSASIRQNEQRTNRWDHWRHFFPTYVSYFPLQERIPYFRRDTPSTSNILLFQRAVLQEI